MSLLKIETVFIFKPNNQFNYWTRSVSTDGLDERKIDMTGTNEPADATKPVNWRIIQEEFPDSDGDGDVVSCKCKTR